MAHVRGNNTETFDMEELKGSYAVGGVDLSSTTDLMCNIAYYETWQRQEILHTTIFLPEEGLSNGL